MRKINGKLFLGLLVGTVVLTGAVFAVHHFQYQRIARALLWHAVYAESRPGERDPQRQVEASHQVGEKQQAAGEHADDRQFPAVVFLHYLAGQLLDPLLDTLRGNQHVRRDHGGPRREREE